MVTKALDDHITVTKGVAGGNPRIAGHRITVQNVVIWHELLGLSADEIAAEHDLTLSDVYAALAYYYDHQAEIDKSIKDSESIVKTLTQKTPSRVSQKLNAQKT
ncbi:MAG: DUF433 domain-containing protein [Candidatus Brocadiaceae bacterium]|nr:DUF433 domain-containing protein [Candidatus Brocadiaceae bacterium]